MSRVYDHPELYAAAFSFRDIPREVTVMVQCMARFSRVPVTTILELACGPGPHSHELVRRGYRYVGLDLNPAMIAYLRSKASDERQVTGIVGDMCSFSLDGPADFAFVALGSLYAQTKAELYSHFACVSKALRPGALYLMDWCVYFSSLQSVHEAWDVSHGELQLHVDVRGTVVDPVGQVLQEMITVEGTDRGRPVRLSTTDVKRVIYPQEFLLLVQHETDFEFLGWWNDWNLDDPIPSERAINRPLIVVRKRGS